MKGKLLLPILLMVVFALTRWPGIMPRNFSAAYALMFCAGVFFPGRLGWWVPIVTNVAMDCVLSLFYYHTNPFSIYMVPNYLAYLVIIYLGKKFSARAHLLKLICGGLLSAIIFYIVTNTSSWIELPYAKTLAGWLQALTTGLPGYPPTWEFFRNTLLSGGLFSALFAGAVKANEALEEKEKENEETEEEEKPAPEAEPAADPTDA